MFALILIGAIAVVFVAVLVILGMKFFDEDGNDPAPAVFMCACLAVLFCAGYVWGSWYYEIGQHVPMRNWKVGGQKIDISW